MSVEKRAIQFGSRVAKLSDAKAKLSRQAADVVDDAVEGIE
jgi:hypothetical protein